MDWIDYRESLGIGFNDENKINYFMTKIFNILEDIQITMNYRVSSDEYYRFCNITGTPMRHGTWEAERFNAILFTLEKHKAEFTDFIAYYIAFVNCQEDNEYRDLSKNDFKNILCQMLTESHIPYDLLEDGENIFLFPKGAKELDDALVSDVLLWLKDYPLTRKAWIVALKDYSESDEYDASEIADKFRKALERFFQEFFNKKKSLENFKSEYGKYLSSKGVPTELINNFEKLLDLYTKFNNNYAKHQDETSSNVLEYIMYQTGSIMRLLITLNKG